jgi:hypothetical protein
MQNGTCVAVSARCLQIRAGATGLEPATSGVTGVTKPFQPISSSRRIGEIKPFSAGSGDPRFRLIAPGRFQLVSMDDRRPRALASRGPLAVSEGVSGR